MPMKLNEFCKHIIFSPNLRDKLTSVDVELNFDWDPQEIPGQPARHKKIVMSDKNLRFPRGHFHEVEKKAMALHSFANHELLATEIMAAVILFFPHNSEEMKKLKVGIFHSLRDEQKHCDLYVRRLNELGFEFGDFPLNDFFWKYIDKMKTPQNYLSVMALTFENANLDFAHFYYHLFKELGDHKTASILKVVLDDEISHVRLGVTYLNRWRKEKDLWTYYNEHLPYPLSPARAKGKFFIEEVRRKARLDDDFIQRLHKFDDDFSVTKRKEWKK